jgi:hypothetical protein
MEIISCRQSFSLTNIARYTGEKDVIVREPLHNWFQHPALCTLSTVSHLLLKCDRCLVSSISGRLASNQQQLLPIFQCKHNAKIQEAKKFVQFFVTILCYNANDVQIKMLSRLLFHSELHFFARIPNHYSHTATRVVSTVNCSNSETFITPVKLSCHLMKNSYTVHRSY